MSQLLTPTHTLMYAPRDGLAFVLVRVEGQPERRMVDLPEDTYATLPIAARAARAAGIPVTHWEHAERPGAPLSLEGMG